MLRDYVYVTIGVLTLLASSVAVYGILNLNTEIQGKTDQNKVMDYSAKLDSLSTQIDLLRSNLMSLDNLRNNLTAINEKLASLDDMNNKIADIQGKLAVLQTNNQPQQIVSVSQNLAMILDKSSYLPGDTVTITAVGANLLKVVQVELLDSQEFVLIHKETMADSTGKVTYQLQLSPALPLGNYVVRLVSDQLTATQQIAVSSSNAVQSSTGSTSSSSNGLTAQTDKTTYHTGGMVQVLGKGAPNSTVTGVMTSPSGKTYTSAAGTAGDGSYVMFYSPTQPYEVGQWTITLTNLGNTVTLHITIANT